MRYVKNHHAECKV